MQNLNTVTRVGIPVPQHREDVKGLDWSLIASVEEGEKWAKALGLCRFIDVSTGRQTIGALNARDVYASITVVIDKFGVYL